MIKEQAKSKNADFILLGTQRGYPAHSFYLKNHFKEVFTAMLLYCDIANEDC